MTSVRPHRVADVVDADFPFVEVRVIVRNVSTARYPRSFFRLIISVKGWVHVYIRQENLSSDLHFLHGSYVPSYTTKEQPSAAHRKRTPRIGSVNLSACASTHRSWHGGRT